jgi:predicted NBD/HSP70 family sugar kinase
MMARWSEHTDASLAVAIEILRHGPIARTDIAHRLELSAGSLTRLCTPLLEEGLIREVGDANDGRVGRPRQLLDVNPDSRSFVGIKLRESEVIAALTNLRGGIIRHAAAPLEGMAPAAVVDVIGELVTQLADGAPISGIGIGIGGVVSDRSLVVRSPYLGWHDVELADLVAERTGIATLVDNDVVAFTEYEHWFGEGRDADRFAVVTLGVGTGFGLVVNGAQIVNQDYGLGLVNHWPLDPAGPMCPRGHRGCADSMLNSDALMRRASDALRRPVDFDEMLRLAEEGQPAARAILDEAGRGLGRLLAAICNLTLPERLIIGGEGVGLARVARGALDVGFVADRDPEATTPEIILATGSNAEWCRGAAVLAIQAFVRRPRPRTPGRSRLAGQGRHAEPSGTVQAAG